MLSSNVLDNASTWQPIDLWLRPLETAQYFERKDEYFFILFIQINRVNSMIEYDNSYLTTFSTCLLVDFDNNLARAYGSKPA